MDSNLIDSRYVHAIPIYFPDLPNDQLTLRQYLVIHSLSLGPAQFNRIWEFFQQYRVSSGHYGEVYSPLISEIYKCLPPIWNWRNFYPVHQWIQEILVKITAPEQENLAAKLSRRKDIQDQLTTVFANYHTHPSSHYIRARESSNLIVSVPLTEQKKIRSPASPLPTAMSSEKLSSLRSIIEARQK